MKNQSNKRSATKGNNTGITNLADNDIHVANAGATRKPTNDTNHRNNRNAAKNPSITTYQPMANDSGPNDCEVK